MAELPAVVGLCPEHAPHFYMPLDALKVEICPECDLGLVLYVPSAREALLREVLEDVLVRASRLAEQEHAGLTQQVIRQGLDALTLAPATTQETRDG